MRVINQQLAYFQLTIRILSLEPSHFPFKIQTKLDNSSIINFSYISLRQDVKRK